MPLSGLCITAFCGFIIISAASTQDSPLTLMICATGCFV
nr:MAG TPA_asm: hypothetical protein [Caudoviricetes sp.]